MLTQEASSGIFFVLSNRRDGVLNILLLTKPLSLMPVQHS